MRGWKSWLAAAICAATIPNSESLPAQVVAPNPQSNPPGIPSSQARDRQSGSSDATLEIAPRTGPSDSEEFSTPSTAVHTDPGNAADQELPPLPTSGPPSSTISNAPRQALPYLGISVQRIESHSTPGRDIEGLEVISVDPGSPAERAGLKGRGAMTKLGASSATAAALMAPLDIAVMPLLKRTGQLGQTGDLIVAIDDRRVASETDLQTALAESRPSDTIYLTILRLATDGAHRTIKFAVKLGNETAAQ
jgi:hypothetical protein